MIVYKNLILKRYK